MRTVTLPRRTPGRGTSTFYGLWGAATMVLMAGLDVQRKLTPEQPILFSLVPVVFCVVGALIAILRGRWRIAPIGARRAVTTMGIMLALTAFIGFAEELPPAQVVAGLVSYGAMLGGLVMGLALRADAPAWRLFRSTMVLLLLANCAVAGLQQFGLLQSDVLEAIEGAHTMRGIRGEGVFTYTTGLFRTSEVFVAFLALTALVVCTSASEAPNTKLGPFRTLVLLALTLGTAILTARRSGFILQVAAVLPFLILYAHRFRVALTTAMLASLLVVTLLGSSAPSEVDLKMQHMGVPEGVSTRLEWALDVRPQDWDLVSVTGKGLGSHGFAVRASGPYAEAMELDFMVRHPLMHYSWFTDLVVLGLLGALLHFAAFMFLLHALVSAARSSKLPHRWSGTCYFVAGLVIYYFVSAALMLTLSNGLMAGMAIGLSLISSPIALSTNRSIAEGNAPRLHQARPPAE